MQTHGFVRPGELIAVAIMVLLAIGAIVLAIVAGVRWIAGLPSADWLAYAGGSAGFAFLVWLFM